MHKRLAYLLFSGVIFFSTLELTSCVSQQTKDMIAAKQQEIDLLKKQAGEAAANKSPDMSAIQAQLDKAMSDLKNLKVTATKEKTDSTLGIIADTADQLGPLAQLFGVPLIGTILGFVSQKARGAQVGSTQPNPTPVPPPTPPKVV